VTKQERDQLRKFLDDYDHGRMPGTIVPENVVEGLRQLLAEYIPPIEQRCSWPDCMTDATWWATEELIFCEHHPIEAMGGDVGLDGEGGYWQQRYGRLRNAVEGAVSQNGSFQELGHAIREALTVTHIKET
jgi:hypothetical protein